jgi:hypothetical protein
MSELEKARAGFVLSLLIFASGLVLLQHEHPAGVATAEQTITVCAATKGALCTPADATGGASDAHEARVADGGVKPLGAMTVTAPRVPTQLGEMLVLAPRFATELEGRLRLATARGPAEGEIILAQ